MAEEFLGGGIFNAVISQVVMKRSAFLNSLLTLGQIADDAFTARHTEAGPRNTKEGEVSECWQGYTLNRNQRHLPAPAARAKVRMRT